MRIDVLVTYSIVARLPPKNTQIDTFPVCVVNNVCGCNWDGGDCCGGNVKKTHCKDCKASIYGRCDQIPSLYSNVFSLVQCLDPLLSKLKCDKKCGKPDYKKDSYCDDVNNHCGCDWDGGDCCGGAVQKKYCKECKCLDPKA